MRVAKKRPAKPVHRETLLGKLHRETLAVAALGAGNLDRVTLLDFTRAEPEGEPAAMPRVPSFEPVRDSDGRISLKEATDTFVAGPDVVVPVLPAEEPRRDAANAEAGEEREMETQEKKAE